jgi:hypothetical protein
MSGILDTAVRVLRAPEELLTDDRDALGRSAPSLLALVVVGAATWGLVVASLRGGLQLVYAPAKAPFLWLIPVAVCLPVMRPWFDPDGDRIGAVRLGAIGLVGAARSALLAAAAAPVLWLVLSLGLSYHLSVLVMAASLALAGLPGLLMVARAMATDRPRWAASAASVLLLGAVTAQTGWLLRPFVVRPTAQVTLLRDVEADVSSALSATTVSFLGMEADWEAAPSGYLGRQQAPRPGAGPVVVPLAPLVAPAAVAAPAEVDLARPAGPTTEEAKVVEPLPGGPAGGAAPTEKGADLQRAAPSATGVTPSDARRSANEPTAPCPGCAAERR